MQRRRELSSTGLLSKWLQWPELAWFEAGSQEILPRLPWGCRIQGLEPSPTAFPYQKQGAGLEVKLLRYKPEPIWNVALWVEN